ncbi:MAG: 7TM diverse intracellular signaling domain-containing protein [Cyclobacteriaceae bacterium]|jgi:signal transduction histidine kinase|nr:sensor histidine kinase [Flammeovirgaceae bacterium]
MSGSLYARLLLNLFFLLAGDRIFSQSTPFVVLSEKNQSVEVLGRMGHLRDEKNRLSIQDVSSMHFDSLHAQRAPSFGFDNATHWFKITLKNHSAIHDWLIEVAYPPLDSVDLFYQDTAGWHHKTGGDHYPMATREIKHRHVTFSLPLSTQESVTLYLKIRSTSSMQVPITIWSKEEFGNGQYRIQFINGIFYGMMLIMIFYNLFLYFSIRDKTTLYYVFALASGTNVIAFFQGYGFFYVYGNYIPSEHLFTVFSGPLFIVCSAALTRSFLNLKSFSPTLDSILKANIIVTIGAVAIILLFPVSFKALHVLTFLNCLLILICASYCFYKKYRPARYFLLAWVALLLAAALFSLRNLGFIPANWLTDMALYIGGILQTLFISFALGDRINLLVKENQVAKEKELQLEHLAKEKLEQEVKDRTEEIQNKNEQLEELNEVKDKLFSVVAHDLKGPLNSLKGTLSILRMGVLSKDEFNELAKSLDTQLIQTTYFLENLLQWGRTQIQGELYSPQPIHLDELAKTTIDLLHSEIEQKKIRISLESMDHAKAFGDKNMTLTVIRNLLSNAIKFTNSGGSVRCIIQPKDNLWIVSVVDSGTGIPPKYLENIFSLKGISTLGTREEKGTGIGLVLCKEFVEQNGGKIWCESTLGKGSTFSFSLPQNASKPIN